MGVFDSIRGWFTSGKPAPITELAGSDGVSAPGGYLWRGEKDPELLGRQQWLTFSNAIANSIVVAAATRYFLNLIAGTEWEAEPREEAGKDGKRACDIVREGLFEADMERPWAATVRKAALYKFYGFAMHEWSIKRRNDGLIVYAAIQHRPQYTIHWWDKPTEQSPLYGVVQQTRQGHRYYIPRERLFYCVDDTLTDSPDGMGMMRHVIAHTKRIERYEQLEGIGFETDLRGIPSSRAPIAKLKAYATANKLGDAWVEQQLEAVVKFGSNHIRTADLSIVLDSSPYFDKEGHPSAVPQWAIDLIKGDGAPLAEVAAAINRCSVEVARVIGAEFMMMGASSSGSHAMHADKTSQFGNLIQSTLGEMAGYARNDLARPLVGMNGLDSDTCTPTLLPGAVSTEAVAEVTKSLLDLAQAGAPLAPNDPAVNQIRARLHLAAQPTITPDLGGMLPRTGKPGAPAPSPAAGAKPSATEDDSIDVAVDDLESGEAAGLVSQ